VGWVIIHWFELGTLALLCLNLWFVSSVLNANDSTLRKSKADRPDARDGTRLDDAFAFLAALGYRGFRFEPAAGLVPIAMPGDSDYWFIPAEHPA